MKMKSIVFLCCTSILTAADQYLETTMLKVEVSSDGKQKTSLEVSADFGKSLCLGHRFGSRLGGAENGRERELRQVALIFGSTRMAVDSSHSSCFKNPHPESGYNLTRLRGKYLLGLSGGDGERSYSVVYVFSKDKYLGFYAGLTNGVYVPSNRNFLRGDIKVSEAGGCKFYESTQSRDLMAGGR